MTKLFGVGIDFLEGLLVRLKKKSESDTAIEKVLLDAKARSRNEERIVRTDWDGILGRSKSFQESKEKEKFIY